MYPEELKYSKEHEWAKKDGDLALVGITHFAQDELGDVVFVELPKVGQEFKAGAEFGVVESVKTVSTLYAPVSGVIEAINEDLNNSPADINSDPYGKGWIIKIKMNNPEEINSLLTSQDYQSHIKK